LCIDNHLDSVWDGDGEVLEAARGGDRNALEALVTAHYDRVHALCRRMLGNDADALDATQDALLAAIRALSRFDGRSSFGTWIYRIATNVCIDEMRRRRRRPMTGLAADVADVADEISFGAPGLFVLPTRPDKPSSGATGDTDSAGTGPPGRGVKGLRDLESARGAPDPADIAAARVDIDAALAGLPVEFRTAVVLRDVCDLPYEEIADILDVPVGTVRSRIARARSALAQTWRSEKPERGASSSGAVAGPEAGNHSGAPVVRTTESGRTGAVAPQSHEEGHTQ